MADYNGFTKIAQDMRGNNYLPADIKRLMGVPGTTVDSFGKKDILEHMIGGFQPLPGVKASDYHVPQELSRAPETVLPSSAWWRDRGIDDPNWHDRMGTLQAGALGGLNGLAFGVPGKLYDRPGAEAAAEKLDGSRMPELGGLIRTGIRAKEVMGRHGYASMAGEVAGTIGNPANSVYRAAGDALAKREFGTAAQAGADALSYAGVNMATDTLGHGGIKNVMSNGELGSIAALRYFMPKVDPNLLQRAWAGAKSGVAGGMTAAVLPGADDFDYVHAAILPIAMATHGAGLRAKGAISPQNRTDASELVSKRFGNWDDLGMAGVGTGFAVRGADEVRKLMYPDEFNPYADSIDAEREAARLRQNKEMY